MTTARIEQGRLIVTDPEGFPTEFSVEDTQVIFEALLAESEGGALTQKIDSLPDTMSVRDVVLRALHGLGEFGVGFAARLQYANAVVEALTAAGRLIPEGATWEYLLREPGREPGGAVRKSRAEILSDVEYVSRRWGPREAVGRLVGPWVEVPNE